MNDLELELMIQRCVDGELDSHRQAEFLRMLDATGERREWRRLALAFVENQALAAALDGKDEPGVQLPSAPAPVLAKRNHVSWKVTAAAALLGVALGIVGAGFGRSSAREVDVVAQEPASNVPAVADVPPEPEGSISSEQPVMNLTLVGLNGPESEPVSVSLPVYLPGQRERNAPEMEPFSQVRAWQHYLESQGYAVERHREYLRFPLDDGRQIIVPSESVRVKYAVQ